MEADIDKLFLNAQKYNFESLYKRFITRIIYIYIYIYIKPIGFTHSSDHFTISPSTSSLKILHLSFNQTVPILWNNLPKSTRPFTKELPNSPTTCQCSSSPLPFSKTNFRSHLKRYIFNISYPC